MPIQLAQKNLQFTFSLQFTLVVAIDLYMIWPLKLFSANGVFERETEKYIVQKMSSKTYHDIPSVTHTKPSSLVETTSAFSSFGKILPGFFSNLKLSNLIRMYQVQTRFLDSSF